MASQVVELDGVAELDSYIRGYHAYTDIWSPVVGEILHYYMTKPPNKGHLRITDKSSCTNLSGIKRFHCSCFLFEISPLPFPLLPSVPPSLPAGGKDDWSKRGMVLWTAICGHKGPHYLAETQQKGDSSNCVYRYSNMYIHVHVYIASMHYYTVRDRFL